MRISRTANSGRKVGTAGEARQIEIAHPLWGRTLSGQTESRRHAKIKYLFLNPHLLKGLLRKIPYVDMILPMGA